MQVSFNPSYSYKPVAFASNKQQLPVNDKRAEKERRANRTKQVVRSATAMVFAANLLYFALKRNFKINRNKAAEAALKKQAESIAPKVKLDISNIDNFIVI